jgi:hypothetical protein
MPEHSSLASKQKVPVPRVSAGPVNQGKPQSLLRGTPFPPVSRCACAAGHGTRVEGDIVVTGRLLAGHGDGVVRKGDATG